jgi:hypothetical protein
MDELSLGGERGMSLKLGRNAGFIADQKEARLWVADQRYGGGGDDHAWSVVPAHGVERDGDWSTHSQMPIRKMFMRRNGRGNPRK